MTLEEVDLMVERVIAQYGVQAFESAADKRKVVNRALKRITKQTKMLWLDQITLDLTAGRALYPMRVGRETTFEYFKVNYNGGDTRVEVVELDVVYIASKPLYDFRDEPGLVSVQDMDIAYPGWQDNSVTSTGVVQRAMVVQGSSLLLWDTPNSDTVASGNHYVRGCYAHPTVDGTTAQSYPVAVPVDYESVLEDLIAEVILKDYASGQQMEVQQSLVKKNVGQLADIASEIKASTSNSNLPRYGWDIQL